MEIQSFFWYIMSVEKNKRLRKQTFVFRKPLTNAPPASAGSGARQRVGMSGPAPLTKIPSAKQTVERKARGI